MDQGTDAIRDFLARRRIAVAGVSRDRNATANLIFRKLRDAGYEVSAVNPAATEVEGVRCHPDLASIQPSPEAVVVITPPSAALGIVKECATLGIPRVWFHRLLFVPGAATPDALGFAREHGIAVIPGACPMMFVEPVDGFHKLARWMSGYRRA